MLVTNRLARLQGKYDHIRRTLEEANPSSSSGFPHNASTRKSRRKRIGGVTSTPRLFGGSLEEYIELVGEEIPTVLKSCIRVINLYGRKGSLSDLTQLPSNPSLDPFPSRPPPPRALPRLRLPARDPELPGGL